MRLVSKMNGCIDNKGNDGQAQKHVITVRELYGRVCINYNDRYNGSARSQPSRYYVVASGVRQLISTPSRKVTTLDEKSSNASLKLDRASPGSLPPHL